MKNARAILSVLLYLPGVWYLGKNVARHFNDDDDRTMTQNRSGVDNPQLPSHNLVDLYYVTPNWNFSLTTTSPETIPAGPATIVLPSCPLGIDTASASHNYTYSVYLTGGLGGSPEAMAVTGGSCKPGDSGGGTITVMARYPHGRGYTVNSASGGIQEAWNNAWTTDSVELNSPTVKLVSNTIYNVYATVYLRGRGAQFDGTGGQIACYTRDRCFYLGITRGYPSDHYITLRNVFMTPALAATQQSTANISAISATASRLNSTFTVTTAATHSFLAGDSVACEYSTTGAAGRFVGLVSASGLGATTFQTTIASSANFIGSGYTFGFCHILSAGIEDNSNGAVLENFQVSQSSNVPAGVFAFAFINDNDQHAVLNQPVNRGGSLSLDNDYPLSAFIYQRTDQGFAGITNIEDGEISDVNCFTGGGNGMTVRNTVCQGFPTFGFRYFGGLQPATIENVYEESGAGTNNPLYGYPAAMGFLTQGGTGIRNVGTWPWGGLFPVFNCKGGAPGTQRNYYVIPRNGGGYYGPMEYIGSSSRTNCSGVSVQLKWPAIVGVDNTGRSAGAVTWDVVYTIGASGGPPIPGQMTAYLAANQPASSMCGTNGVCSISDPQTQSTTHLLPSQGNFAPKFWFWPSTWTLNGGMLIADQVAENPGIVSSLGFLALGVVAQQCYSAGQEYQRSQVIISCLNPPSGPAAGSQAEVIVQHDAANNGPAKNSKGWLNLGLPPTAPIDLITLGDSNPYKTYSTGGGRPPNDAADLALGIDQTGGLAERAQASISSYINAVPGKGKYQERLTAEAKIFNVPVFIRGHLNQDATGNFAGTCSMSGRTSCKFILSSPYTHASPICIPAAQGSKPIAAACSVSGGTVTITAAANNSETWGAILIGNPN